MKNLIKIVAFAFIMVLGVNTAVAQDTDRPEVVAKQEKVPIYIAAPLLKFYPYSKIKIEQRSPTEIWPRAPKKLKIINFAFDSIPAKYISGIICEAGIIKPTALKQTVKRLYPWLLKEK